MDIRQLRAVPTAVALVLSAGVTAAVAGTAPARADTSAVKVPAVISLGDSYISGEAARWRGNGDTILPGSRYGTDLAAYDCNSSETWCYHDPERVYGQSYENGCDRAKKAEITKVDKVRVGTVDYPIAAADRANVACSGATTAAVDKDRFKGEAPQVKQLADYAKKKAVKLVALSIGGNDLGFSDIVTYCMGYYVAGLGPCKTGYAKVLPGKIAKMAAAVRTTLQRIRATMTAAGYQNSDYRLVLQSYPSPIPRGPDNRYPEFPKPGEKSRTWDGGCPFYNEDSNWAYDTVIPGMASALAGAATSEQAEFLDLRFALRGHEVCAKGVRQATAKETLAHPIPKPVAEWVRWIGVTQGAIQEDMHPNSYGQEQFGACLRTAATGSGRTHTCTAP
ncbi:GDSL-type esterase/lipase family protein [Actinokineospora sp. NBRC 105648]|uniref:GDSL-type esterase/lipase family protein n=1 Tax=Actinokineospora sp. NBRC 105648 TaxID=3032206 RepID=UPI0024A0D0FD|nr:GDSL-type esterase/lipase family protein [Actinokineospora sp. NBRC 105648]GLZ37085.1 hypothetical protein Acsp05_07100 [Actinokineospora sp. NBRC 105648]